MWLYKEYGYISIPSTCKNSTELYECVLINPNKISNKEIYIQVKKGDVNLKYSDYKNLDGEVWLFTTRGKVNGQKQVNMKTIDPKMIFEFVINYKNDNLIPNKILKWRDLLVKN